MIEIINLEQHLYEERRTPAVKPALDLRFLAARLHKSGRYYYVIHALWLPMLRTVVSMIRTCNKRI